MPDIELKPLRSPFRASVALPGSKSLTNRALVLASMAKGRTILSNVLFADDTRVMLDSLTRLGYQVEIDEPSRTVSLIGGDIPNPQAELFCGNSGTTLRFLAAAVARGKGTYKLDGIQRMRERPVKGLADLLKNLGVRVSYEMNDGYPPITVHADTLPGGLLTFASTVSSQYLSAVLMVAPYARHEVRIRLEGKQSSWPYVAMTMRMMDHFDHIPELERDPNTGEPVRIIVPQGSYRGRPYQIEPDASNASYFLAAAALHPGCSMMVEGLGRYSLQGDVAVADYLGKMGAEVNWAKDHVTVTGTDTLEGIEVDLTATPDIAQTLAVVAAFASSPTKLTGLHTLRVKETDRVAALQNELTKLGCKIEIHESQEWEGSVGMTIHPADRIKPARIHTYDDHRMAMSFAIAATRAPGVIITEAQCCSKTYPEFFDDFSKAVGTTAHCE